MEVIIDGVRYVPAPLARPEYALVSDKWHWWEQAMLKNIDQLGLRTRERYVLHRSALRSSGDPDNSVFVHEGAIVKWIDWCRIVAEYGADCYLLVGRREFGVSTRLRIAQAVRRYLES